MSYLIGNPPDRAVDLMDSFVLAHTRQRNVVDGVRADVDQGGTCHMPGPSHRIKR